jgi:hypothetical protein
MVYLMLKGGKGEGIKQEVGKRRNNWWLILTGQLGRETSRTPTHREA